MDLKTYQKEAARTCPELPKTYEHMDSLHMVMGLDTEVGELVDVFKKNLAYGKPIDWVNVKEEVVDIMWYLVNFCRIHNIDIEEQMDRNINKLRQRYPDRFDSHLAVNRNLDLERKILEE